MTYEEMKAKIAGSMTASFWMKGATAALDKRDPVDAIKDVEVLLELCKKRLEAPKGIPCGNMRQLDKVMGW